MSNKRVAVMGAHRFKLNLDKSTIIRLASLNVHGLCSEVKKSCLIKYAINYKCDIISLQETKSPDIDRNIDGFRLLTFEAKNRHYGLGFVLSPRIAQHVSETWVFSDRIAVLRLSSTEKGRRRFLSVINVYAPTSPVSKDRPEIRDKFYQDLQDTITKQKGDTILIAGDLNSKVGSKQDEVETCLGSFSKGKQNENGEELVRFCLDKSLFISNSAFKHKSAHITTWTGQWTDKNTGKTFPIYNQIDFILVPNWLKQNLINSRTYSGILATTDHRLLIKTLTQFKCSIYKISIPNKQRDSPFRHLQTFQPGCEI